MLCAAREAQSKQSFGSTQLTQGSIQWHSIAQQACLWVPLQPNTWVWSVSSQESSQCKHGLFRHFIIMSQPAPWLPGSCGETRPRATNCAARLTTQILQVGSSSMHQLAHTHARTCARAHTHTHAHAHMIVCTSTEHCADASMQK